MEEGAPYGLHLTSKISLFFRWQSTTAAAAAAQYSNFSRAAAASAGTALPPSRPYLNPTTSLEAAAAYSPYHLGSTTPQSFTTSVSSAEKESKTMIGEHGTTYQTSTSSMSATSTNFSPYHNLGNYFSKLKLRDLDFHSF